MVIFNSFLLVYQAGYPRNFIYIPQIFFASIRTRKTSPKFQARFQRVFPVKTAEIS